MKQNYSETLDTFIAKEKAATNLINSVGNLLYEKGIELVLFRRHLIDKNVSDILRLHQYASQFVKKPISVFETSKMTEELNFLSAELFTDTTVSTLPYTGYYNTSFNIHFNDDPLEKKLHAK